MNRLLAVVLAALALAGCNTFAGLGRDLSALGDAMSRAGQGSKK